MLEAACVQAALVGDIHGEATLLGGLPCALRVDWSIAGLATGRANGPAAVEGGTSMRPEG